jgi:hypothetical protein
MSRNDMTAIVPHRGAARRGALKSRGRRADGEVMKRGVLVACVIVLAVAIPAGTASGGSISVQASVAGCKPASDGAVACQIDASFTGVGGADHYTASVTRPDGVTQSFGTVPAGSASVWPTYSGDGVYTVTITAWDDGRNVQRGTASAGG